MHGAISNTESHTTLSLTPKKLLLCGLPNSSFNVFRSRVLLLYLNAFCIKLNSTCNNNTHKHKGRCVQQLLVEISYLWGFLSTFFICKSLVNHKLVYTAMPNIALGCSWPRQFSSPIQGLLKALIQIGITS